MCRGRLVWGFLTRMHTNLRKILCARAYNVCVLCANLSSDLELVIGDLGVVAHPTLTRIRPSDSSLNKGRGTV